MKLLPSTSPGVAWCGGIYRRGAGRLESTRVCPITSNPFSVCTAQPPPSRPLSPPHAHHTTSASRLCGGGQGDSHTERGSCASASVTAEAAPPQSPCSSAPAGCMFVVWQRSIAPLHLHFKAPHSTNKLVFVIGLLRSMFRNQVTTPAAFASSPI